MYADPFNPMLTEPDLQVKTSAINNSALSKNSQIEKTQRPEPDNDYANTA